MRHPYRWPLAVAHHRWRDKMRLAAFVLGSNHWTNGRQVARFEAEMASMIGCRYCIFTSSGSTANTLLAMFLKDTLPSWRRTVALPAVTWATSCSPWIREGFTPHFMDVNIHDLSMNLGLLDQWLKANHSTVACIFVTSLLGFSPDLDRLKQLADQYGVLVMLDNCEATLTEYRGKNISSFFTSTLSTYFAHHLQTIEGGFVCTNDDALYLYCLKARDHGMTRALKKSRVAVSDDHFNRSVDWRFDFGVLGNNFRNTEIAALLGRMELKRVADYRDQRVRQYAAFQKIIDHSRFQFPTEWDYVLNVPFALPLICLQPGVQRYKAICEQMGVETRPLVGGNLLRHRAFLQFTPEYYVTPDIEKYKPAHARLTVADMLHQNAFYVGLGNCTSEPLLVELAQRLNQ